MNMSGTHSTNNSVYNTSDGQSPQSKGNTDFISFSNSPGPSFTPPHYSSPLKTDNNRRKNWRKNPNSNVFYYRSPNNSGGSYSGNFSNTSSYNASQTSWSQGSNTSKNENDITRYLHPSFLEDPWKKLEEEYSKRKKLDK